MEEGSLLKVALLKQLHEESDDEQLEREHESISRGSAILFDVYSLNQDHVKDPIQQLIHLAEVGAQCNQFLQSQAYKWHFGGDGPVFGVHATQGIAHLRALCHYGPSVQDEWMGVHYMIQMTKQLPMVAVTCWDVEDGQVILIQASDALPEWVEEDSTDKHRHACWIYRGQIHLLPQPHVTLSQALHQLCSLLKTLDQNHGINSGVSFAAKKVGVTIETIAEERILVSDSSRHVDLQRSLESWLIRVEKQARLLQRTALVLPRKVAYLIRSRPDLVHAAMQAFCQNIANSRLANSFTASSSLAVHCEDWVWTTHAMSRTNYAMARTMVSAEWRSHDYVPPDMNSVEVKRFQRLCKREATPHLRYALQLGIRLVVGFQFLISTEAAAKTPPSSPELRILHWARIANDCHSRTSKYKSNCDNHDARPVCPTLCDLNKEPSSLLQQEFRLGPNHSSYNLEPILKCPVFREEHKYLTCLSHPDDCIRQQFLSELASSDSLDSDNCDDDFDIPAAEDVDDEAWMNLSEGQGGLSFESTGEMDDLLKNFHEFCFNRTSGANGIASTATETNSPPRSHRRKRGPVRPHIFMNILHTILRGESPSFSKIDSFFFREDYELLDDGDENQGTNDSSIENLMRAMDAELKSKATSRTFDGCDGGPCDVENEKIHYDDMDDNVAEGAHVLFNMVQSLDASAGSPGPVTTMLKEMVGTDEELLKNER